MPSIRLSSVGMGAPGGRPRSTIRSMIRLVISSLRCGRATTGSPDSALVGTPTRRTSYVAPAEAVSCESWAMGFVIQIVSGKAEARAVVLDVPGRADSAARDDLGAKTAARACRIRPGPCPPGGCIGRRRARKGPVRGQRIVGASATPRRVCVLSLHTSPLEQPGIGDAGGMNVYIEQTAVRMA